MQTITESTITSANAVLLMKAPGLVDSFQKIRGFAPDTGWGTSEAQMGETQMGIDGMQSGGFTPFEVPISINLAANSPAQAFFNILVRSMLQNQEIVPIEWSLELKSIKKRYKGTGFFVSGTIVPTGGTVLQPTAYTCNTVITDIQDI